MQKLFALLLGLLVLTGLASSSLFVADENTYTLVRGSGQVQRIISQPGLQAKLPWPLQELRSLDKRLLTTAGDNGTQPVTAAQQDQVLASWYVQWRITDAQQYLQSVGDSTDAGKNHINEAVRNAVKTAMSQNDLRHWLTAAGRKSLEDALLQHLQAASKTADKPWGVDVQAVRINRIDVDQAGSEKLFAAMKQDLANDASRLRADNTAELAANQAKREAQRQQTLLEAQQQAQQIRGDADAQAIRIYAQDYAKDPQFANFYRGLSVYRKSFDGNDVLVVDPAKDSFLQNLRQGGSSTVDVPAAPAKKTE